MAFDSLSEKLQNVFKNLRSKGRLTEADVKTALKEVKMALLRGGCQLQGRQAVRQGRGGACRRTGRDERTEPGADGHQDCKRRDGQADGLGDNRDHTAARARQITVIMMAGLQGAGKTTTAAKLAGKFKQKGKKATSRGRRCLSAGSDRTVTDQRTRSRAWKYFPWAIRTAR